MIETINKRVKSIINEKRRGRWDAKLKIYFAWPNSCEVHREGNGIFETGWFKILR